MNDSKPYGHSITFKRAKPNGGVHPEFEEVTIERKGSENAARRAAGLTPGYREVVSIRPISQAQAPAPRQRKAKTFTADPVTFNETKVLSRSECDEAEIAVCAVKKAAAELAGIASQKKTLLRQIETNLDTIARLLPEPEAPSGKSGTDKLKARCDDLYRLINMEEFESWQITVNQVMMAALQRLP